MPLSMSGIIFQTRKALKPGLKIPFRMCAQQHKDEGNTHVAGQAEKQATEGQSFTSPVSHEGHLFVVWLVKSMFCFSVCQPGLLAPLLLSICKDGQS